MKKYDLNLLKNYLICNSECEKIELTLEEIEKIIGGKLPEFSYQKTGHYRFWYNSYYNNSTYAPYWLDAGFNAHCNIDKGIVIFSKTTIKCTDLQKKKATRKVYYNDLDINVAIDAIKKYHYSVNKNYTRYKSWEHCYCAFKLYRHDKEKIEFLCLHLSCYLASWGMLRNSALINYDYLVHKDFVEQISNSKYDKLYDDNYYDIDLIIELVDLINEVYPDTISKTKTFITKILLGVFGCAPAYDRYFCKALKKHNVCSVDFNLNSLKNLYSYYQLHFNEFEELRNQFLEEDVFYTPMKLIDMCFWQLGFDMNKQ